MGLANSQVNVLFEVGLVRRFYAYLYFHLRVVGHRIKILFIAGIQLYILSEQTEYYFAWTISLPLTAAFLGAGYWAAMGYAYMNWWDDPTVAARSTGLTAIAATLILGITTFLHLDKFHLS